MSGIIHNTRYRATFLLEWVKAIVDGWVDSLTFEKDTIIFEKGSSVGAEDKIVLSVVEGEEIPPSLTLRETNNNYPNGYGSVQRLDFELTKFISPPMAIKVQTDERIIFIFSKGLYLLNQTKILSGFFYK